MAETETGPRVFRVRMKTSRQGTEDAHGHPYRVGPGDLLELPEAEARELVGRGLAEFVGDA